MAKPGNRLERPGLLEDKGKGIMHDFQENDKRPVAILETCGSFRMQVRAASHTGWLPADGYYPATMGVINRTCRVTTWGDWCAEQPAAVAPLRYVDSKGRTKDWAKNTTKLYQFGYAVGGREKGAPPREWMEVVTLDIDGGMTMEHVVSVLGAYEMKLTPTHSWKPDHQKFRVDILADWKMTHAENNTWIAEFERRLGAPVDACSYKEAQHFFKGSYPSDEEPRFATRNRGSRLTREEFDTLPPYVAHAKPTTLKRSGSTRNQALSCPKSPIDLLEGESDFDAVARSRVLALLAANGRLIDEDCFESPFLHYSQSDSPPSADRLVGSTLHSLRGYSLRPAGMEIGHAQLLRAIETEYVHGTRWADSVVTTESYPATDASVFCASPDGRPRVYVLCSAVGSGKSTMAASLLGPLHPVVVQAREMLALSQASQFAVPSYKDGPVTSLRAGIALCSDSLHKLEALATYGDAPGGLFVDEIGTTLMSLIGRTQMKAGTCYSNARTLATLIRRQEYVVAADATFTPSMANALRALVPGVEIVAVVSKAAERRYAGAKFHRELDAASCVSRTLSALADPARTLPVAVVSTSASFLRALRLQASLSGYSVGARIGQQADEEDMRLEDAPGYDLLLLSPAAAQGVSFTNPVHCLVVCAPYDPTGTTHGLGATVVIQLTGRFRNVPSGNYYCFVAALQCTVPAIDEVEEGIKRTAVESTTRARTDYGTCHDEGWLRCRANLQQGLLLDGYRVRDLFEAYYAAEGADITDGDGARASKDEVAALRSAKDAVLVASAEAAVAAPSMSLEANVKPKLAVERDYQLRTKVAKALRVEPAAVTVADVVEFQRESARDGAALASASLVTECPRAVGARDNRDGAGINDVKFGDLPRSQAVVALMGAAGLSSLLVQADAPPVVALTLVKPGAAAFHAEGVATLRRNGLPTGVNPWDMLTRNAARLGLKLMRNAKAGTVTVDAESWARAWKWAAPAAENMKEQVQSALLRKPSNVTRPIKES